MEKLASGFLRSFGLALVVQLEHVVDRVVPKVSLPGNILGFFLLLFSAISAFKVPRLSIVLISPTCLRSSYHRGLQIPLRASADIDSRAAYFAVAADLERIASQVPQILNQTCVVIFADCNCEVMPCRNAVHLSPLYRAHLQYSFLMLVLEL